VDRHFDVSSPPDAGAPPFPPQTPIPLGTHNATLLTLYAYVGSAGASL